MQLTTHTANRAGLALAAGTALFLLWAIGALGVIGAEGDPADLMYLGVLGIAVGGAVGSGLAPSGMARAMGATVLAQGLVVVIALLAGEHRSPVTSVAEIVGVNAMFMVAVRRGGVAVPVRRTPPTGRRQRGRADATPGCDVGRGQPVRSPTSNLMTAAATAGRRGGSAG